MTTPDTPEEKAAAMLAGIRAAVSRGVTNTGTFSDAATADATIANTYATLALVNAVHRIADELERLNHG